MLKVSVLVLNFNPFFPNAPFLYPLKTSENHQIFRYFQGIEKGCIENKWVKESRPIPSIKSVRIWSFSGPSLPALGLNTEIYYVNLRILTECEKLDDKTSMIVLIYKEPSGCVLDR